MRICHGYREFTNPLGHVRLERWMYAPCLTSTHRLSVLFDRATASLVAEEVLLPGASILERLIARDGRRLWRSLSSDAFHKQRTQLKALLVAGEGRPWAASCDNGAATKWLPMLTI